MRGIRQINVNYDKRGGIGKMRGGALDELLELVSLF